MAKPEANKTAGRFFLSMANKMNARQGGMVNMRMTIAVTVPE
jgi:hypothetical protein